MRIDVFLARRADIGSREKAKRIISDGRVYINGKRCDKPSASVEESDCIEVEKPSGTEYVSRGGYKLEAALDAFSLDVKGLVATDLGASSGGFCDCLLQRGAAKLYAVDCGSGQLAEKLRRDCRVISMEHTNARFLTAESIGEPVDMVVMDLSFISQTLVFPAVCRILRRGGVLISLIKPQFEVGRSYVGKNGIVKNEKVRRQAVERVLDNAASFGLISRGVIESPIRGGDGNVEYLSVFDFLPPDGEE